MDGHPKHNEAIGPASGMSRETEAVAWQLQQSLDVLNGLLNSSRRGQVVQGMRDVLQARASSRTTGRQ